MKFNLKGLIARIKDSSKAPVFAILINDRPTSPADNGVKTDSK